MNKPLSIARVRAVIEEVAAVSREPGQPPSSSFAMMSRWIWFVPS